jgi:hypothetical protein
MVKFSDEEMEALRDRTLGGIISQYENELPQKFIQLENEKALSDCRLSFR